MPQQIVSGIHTRQWARSFLIADRAEPRQASPLVSFPIPGCEATSGHMSSFSMGSYLVLPLGSLIHVTAWSLRCESSLTALDEKTICEEMSQRSHVWFSCGGRSREGQCSYLRFCCSRAPLIDPSLGFNRVLHCCYSGAPVAPAQRATICLCLQASLCVCQPGRMYGLPGSHHARDTETSGTARA